MNYKLMGIENAKLQILSNYANDIPSSNNLFRGSTYIVFLQSDCSGRNGPIDVQPEALEVNKLLL